PQRRGGPRGGGFGAARPRREGADRSRDPEGEESARGRIHPRAQDEQRRGAAARVLRARVRRLPRHVPHHRPLSRRDRGGLPPRGGGVVRCAPAHRRGARAGKASGGGEMSAPRASRRGFVLGAAALLLAADLALAAPVQLPPVTRAKLKNGLTVLVLPTRRLPLVDLRLVSRAGAVNDPAGKEGVASLTADLLTQGAGPRNAQQIAEDIAFVGGTLEASCG